MTCEETRTYLNGYVDGELDLLRSMEVERHAKSCDRCDMELRNLATLHQAMGRPEMRFQAPKNLVASIRKDIAKESAPAKTSLIPSFWRGFAYVGALLLIAAVSVGIWRSSFNRDRIADQVVASHVRSLMASHLYDVESTDQHTVKPWFHGKLDYAPPVQDFVAQGYPLVGGRLDFLEGRPVAAVVYQRRQHPINVFVWPNGDRSDSRPRNLTRTGYNIIEWNKNGMEYWLISDLNDNELRAFARLLQGQ